MYNGHVPVLVNKQRSDIEILMNASLFCYTKLHAIMKLRLKIWRKQNVSSKKESIVF